MRYRIESDSIGKIKVPEDKYWGASTERSNKYFDIGDFLVRPVLIHSIAIIKKAAAKVNTLNKDLDPNLAKYIVKAADEVLSGKLNIPRKFSIELSNSGLGFSGRFFSIDSLSASEIIFPGTSGNMITNFIYFDSSLSMMLESSHEPDFVYAPRA